jgi:hypothetical protein
MDLDAVGEQSEVTHPHEATGDDVKEEAAGELGTGQGFGLLYATVPAVLVAEGHLAILVGEDALIPCVLGEDLGQLGAFGARRSQSLAVRHDDYTRDSASLPRSRSRGLRTWFM